MIRWLLYFMMAYIAWKVIKMFSARKGSKGKHFDGSTSPESSTINFPSIEEAKFEDLPPDPPPDNPSSK